ncbi:MAG: ATP-dependent sacrificial sulfur transferase LarE [Candidatus Polarisedimenticolia bacterium]
MQPRTSGAGAAAGATLEDRQSHLEQILRDIGSCVIGFSGGADSSLLVKVAASVLGDRALAVTAVSASLAERDRAVACALAADIGVRHLLVDSHEFDDPRYTANAPTRCFFCKQELFTLLRTVADTHGLHAIAYGAITDDLGDFRPGMDAARQAGARAPLLEAGFSKNDVRELSRRLGLSTWDRPASACLSSRVPHGVVVEPSVLRRVELAEDFLLERGFRQVRVRAHGELARVECDPRDLPRLMEPGMREAVAGRLREVGFRHVTVDLEGYRSGSLNPPGAPVPIPPGETKPR